jgi:hypothetical protein
VKVLRHRSSHTCQVCGNQMLREREKEDDDRTDLPVPITPHRIASEETTGSGFAGCSELSSDGLRQKKPSPYIAKV